MVDFSGYALVTAKGGSKFKETRGPVSNAERANIDATGRVQLAIEKGGFPQVFPGRNMGSKLQNGVIRMRFRDYPISDLEQLLSFLLGVHILDKTGLAGRFDFTLEFSPPENGYMLAIGASMPLSPGEVAPLRKAPPQPFQEDSLPIISAAMEKQLGLKLDRFRIPLDTLVIDRVERVPSPN